MATKYAPLVLPTQLHDLLQNYVQIIKHYYVDENLTAQQNLDWFNDFIDLEEVDDVDVKVRLFAKKNCGEFKKWLRSDSWIPNPKVCLGILMIVHVFSRKYEQYPNPKDQVSNNPPLIRRGVYESKNRAEIQRSKWLKNLSKSKASKS